MKIKKLNIERKLYGENEGKLIATIDVEGDGSSMSLELDGKAGEAILKECAPIIAKAAQKKARQFKSELMDAIK